MNNQCLGLSLLASVLLYGCATPERVILLPEADGTQSAVIIHARKGGELVLDRPYVIANVTQSQIKSEMTDEKTVNTRYQAVIEALPVRARSYTLNFEFGNIQLTAESRTLLDKILQEMLQLPAPELILIGHADDVGTEAINDKLSLERANSVLRLIKAKGITPHDVTTVGRGKRDPLYPAKKGTQEPGNRRVEIHVK